MTGILQLHGYGIAVGERTAFSSLDLELPGNGISAIMGPPGSYKSLLLRTLAGMTAGNPFIRTWGQALYQGTPLSACLRRPALVAQRGPLLVSSVLNSLIPYLPDRPTLCRREQMDRLERITVKWGQEWIMAKANSQVIHLPYPEQKALAIVRETLTGPRLLMLDEPAANLDDQGALMVMSLIRRIAVDLPLLLVSHRPSFTRKLADRVAQITDGRVPDFTPAAVFFGNSAREAGCHLLGTGIRSG